MLKAANEWKPDLIIVGSHGRTALDRMMLGSVSQKVLSEARSPVRVARGRDTIDGSPVRILIGLDGTPDSNAIAGWVATRHWAERSSVRVVAIADLSELAIPLTFDPDMAESIIETFD